VARGRHRFDDLTCSDGASTPGAAEPGPVVTASGDRAVGFGFTL
jgi:hypothetical protein